MAINLPLDTKLADSINRRRISEELRKQRIFDPKRRQIGVDIDALNYQMQEHMLLKDKEYEIERKFADEIKKQDHLAELFEQKQNEEALEINKKIDEFRLSQQNPELRRDFDLYDPDGLKKECPPRVSDHQPCPISSLQKFEGEDLNYKNRCLKQKEQAKDLLLQQMQEKRMKKYMESKQVHDWELAMLGLDSKALQLAREELENARKNFKKLSDLNKFLALEAAERKMQQTIDEEYEKKKDIENNFYGDLLSENPLVARSAFGSHRVVPDRWKGMNKQQLEEYYDGQIQQIIDKKRDTDRDKYEAAKWNEFILQQASNAQLQEEEELKQRSKDEKKLADENLQLALEQKMQQDYINKVVYANVPSEGYFSQFNTSSR